MHCAVQRIRLFASSKILLRTTEVVTNTIVHYSQARNLQPKRLMQEEIDGLVNGTCSGNGGEVSRLSACATLVAAEPSSAANPFGSMRPSPVQ